MIADNADVSGVPGVVKERIYIPPRGYMKARILHKGQCLRIVDLEGQQCADMILYNAADYTDVFSCVYTMLINQTWQITKGHLLYSKYASLMATMVEDTVGKHYFGGGFCSAEVNRLRYGIEGSPNCRDNLVASMSDYNFTSKNVELDSCISFFMNLGYAPNGTFVIAEPDSKAGDYFDLRAEMDLIVSLSNCPQERSPSNAYNPTALEVIFYENFHKIETGIGIK
ncbi:MAG: DUF1989 domain-containing protein [Bacillota bacterium]